MNKQISKTQRGFSLVELIVVIALIASLSGIVLVNFRTISENAFDVAATTDYRHLKEAIAAIQLDSDSPSRFIFRRRTGPNTFPYPLSMVSLSNDVLASVNYRRRVRNNGNVRTRIIIDVQHVEGSKRLRYVEVNGNITEQVINR